MIMQLITWLVVICVAVMIIRFIGGKFKRDCRRRLKGGEGYIVFAFGSMILFFSIAKWYVFITRYEVEYFAIIIPAVAFCLQKVSERYTICERKKDKLLDGGIWLCACLR